MRRLASERTVAIFDIGEWQGQPYVVMEVLAGGTLDDRIRDVAPTPADVERLVDELAACMTAAHAGGVVHRDIKPSNLLTRSAGARSAEVDGVSVTPADPAADVGGALIGWDEQLVLADFGLARTLGLSDITVAGGTDGFMAPEQRVPSNTVDERADIYAASAVVALAWNGPDGPTTAVELGASSDAVNRVLARGMADDPDDRPSDATQWARDLTAALQASSARSRTDVGKASDVVDDAVPAGRRRVSVIVAAVAGLAVALVAVAVVVTNRGGDESATPTVAGNETAASEVAAETSGSIDAPPIAAFSSAWTTQASAVVDERGTPVRLRGVNWFGFESEVAVVQGLWARNWKDLVDLVAELEFNAIRLPFSSAMLDPGTMPEGIDEALNPDLVGLTSIEVMDAIIDYAAVRGLAIVLDRHALAPASRSPLWYDDTYPAERFISDWELLAERYRNRPNVVGADLYDAPHGSACWGCGDPAIDWRLAAQQAGDAIHRIEPDWLIFVAGVEKVGDAECGEVATTCTWQGSNLSAALESPVELDVLTEPKVVYAPKDFGSSAFEQPWFDDPTFPENMPALWDQWWGELEVQEAAPVVVSGLGSKLDSDVDRIWLDTILRHLDDRDADFFYWSLNPNSNATGGLLGDDWLTVDEEKMAALRPYLTGPFE